MRTKSNRQVNVPIPRGSEMESFYEAEASAQQVKLPTYIYQLLLDRYEALHGRGKSIWFPRGIPTPVSTNHVEKVHEVIKTQAEIALQMFGGEDED